MIATEPKLSFKDLMRDAKLNKKNVKTITVSTYTKNRLSVYKRENELNSQNHAVLALIQENEMLRSIMMKLDSAIKTAKKNGKVDSFFTEFTFQASPKEKALFDLYYFGDR